MSRIFVITQGSTKNPRWRFARFSEFCLSVCASVFLFSLVFLSFSREISRRWNADNVLFTPRTKVRVEAAASPRERKRNFAEWNSTFNGKYARNLDHGERARGRGESLRARVFERYTGFDVTKIKGWFYRHVRIFCPINRNKSNEEQWTRISTKIPKLMKLRNFNSESIKDVSSIDTLLPPAMPEKTSKLRIHKFCSKTAIFFSRFNKQISGFDCFVQQCAIKRLTKKKNPR